MGSSQPGNARAATLLVALCVALAALLACAGAAAAAPRVQSGAGANPSRATAAAAKVARYWTPARMRSARPLEYAVDGDGTGRLLAGVPESLSATATASWANVTTPDALPFAVNGRVFIRQGGLRGFCSGTAINTPTRQLVLTAGHCVASGPEQVHANIWSSYLEFVPAYSGGVAPFGAFVARRGKVFAPKPWIKQGNPDFDLGVFLTHPNPEGINVADAVGGGATILIDQSRHQEFQTFGYPGESTHMEGCRSPYIGDDTLTYPFSGPPTQAIGCRWAPGASGGGWLVGDGSMINGITSYLHLNNRSRTYGPYFAEENIGKLIAGL